MSGKTTINEYFQLRKRIDRQIRHIRALYKSDITCSAGCSSCCINLTVFPIEFYAILQELGNERMMPEYISFDESAACGFLDEQRLCSIYTSRPLICRTHGLPILFLNDSPDNPAWEVSCCESNFQLNSQLELSEECLIDVEEINLELGKLNETFLESDAGAIKTRIPLSHLASYLKH